VVLGDCVGLLDLKDARLKRLAAKDVIDFFVKHKEAEDWDRQFKKAGTQPGPLLRRTAKKLKFR